MKNWATSYFQTKLASQVKTSEDIWNAVAGGLPYARGVRSALEQHPELSQEERERAGGGTLRPMVGGIRSLPYTAAGAGGGALLGAGLGYLTGGAVGHETIGAGLGALGGGAAGGLGGHIFGGFNEGKNLTEEEITEMGKPQEEQRSTFDRHPIASTLGTAATIGGIPFASKGLPGAFAAHPLRSVGVAGAKAALV